MNSVELIEELTAICIKQAEIIKAQAATIEQLGAQALEDPSLVERLDVLVNNR